MLHHNICITATKTNREANVSYSIEKFWRPTFATVERQQTSIPLPGWNAQCQSDDSYVEADLALRPDFPELKTPVWLIAAPGAVGKSTLARQICASTGAVYLDLATAATVAGNSMIGGLAHTGLLQTWQAGKTTIVIDALDEARLRVTQSSFEDFLVDVAQVAAMGTLPLVLLGRVGIIEEAWSILEDRSKINAPIFDIELFDDEQAEKFVFARLEGLSRSTNPPLATALQAHRPIYETSIRRIIERLRLVSKQDGDRFVGYAPVLDAVAKVIADVGNPARIGEATERIIEGKILGSLAAEILRREAGKLVDQLITSNQLPNASDLYTPDEQLDRLACKLFGLQPPSPPSTIPQQALAAYEQAVNNLLPQHPFLDGTGNKASSSVFGACVVAHALRSKDPNLAKASEQHVSQEHHAPNPFLFDFYRIASSDSNDTPVEHVGALYQSLIATAEAGDVPGLSVEARDDNHIDIEMSVSRSNGNNLRAEFTATNSGTLRFGHRVVGVNVDAPSMDVALGTGTQLELIAPITINAQTVFVQANEVVVKTESHTKADENIALIEAKNLLANSGLTPPIVRAGCQLFVHAEESQSYPWTSFSFSPEEDEDPSTADALRALRRIVISFRSHSKGQLARFSGKIEHARMMKGPIGRGLLNKLLADKVVYLDSPMYILDPKALGAVVGISYLDAQLKRYSKMTRAYVQNLQ
ncbi:hypothetical protein K6W78_22985 [Burkholderia cepacia]|uniref:hypothetical protein n=1 Tax=Burkholderia cepacia TaxID=292 RepID=UPI001C980C12|nr:hypothetical protein [Burkholderia cepacia]MBY4802851.1 hypothetical protein [Burkholderia cepacia]